jgi:hypothetical protein
MLRLTKAGFIHAEKGTAVELGSSAFLCSWRYPFTVDKDVTFRDFCLLLMGATTEHLQTIESLCNSNFLPYLAEVKLDTVSDGTIKYLEVFKVVDIETDGTLNVWASAHGRGPPDEYNKESEVDEEGNIAWGLCMTPWSDLLDCTFRFAEEASVTDYRKDPKDIFKDLTKYKMEYTLADFFDGFANEMCFFGSPARQQEADGEIREAIEEIDNGTAECVELTPELMASWLETPKEKP